MIKMVKPGKPKNVRKDFYQGVYMNFNFVSTITAYLGNIVQVHTISGNIFEGILSCFSPNFHVVLELAHEVITSSTTEVSPDNVIQKMFFPPNYIVSLEIIDAESECFSSEIYLNSNEISQITNDDKCLETGKVLEPWDCTEEQTNLHELDITGPSGWDPQEMFEQNERLFGVVSDFKEELYTTPLQPQVNSKTGISPPKSDQTTSIPVTCITSVPNIMFSTKTLKKPKAQRKSEIPTISTSKDNYSHSSPKNIQANIPGNPMEFEVSKFVDPCTSNYQTSGFSISETKTTNRNIPPIPARPWVFNSKLNPNAKEFIPSWTRPAFVTNFQVPYVLPCPTPMNTQAPVLAAPFHLPVPYPTTQLYVWNPVVHNLRQ